MPITPEQLVQFSENPLPVGLVGLRFLEKLNQRIYYGKEALIRQALATDGRVVAFKWYRRLSGQPTQELIKYANQINADEQTLWDAGLREVQVPNSDFCVAEYKKDHPELFAVQAWAEGRLLKDVSLLEIFKNSQLRKSISHLFRACDQAYQQTGRFPDLISGETIRIAGLQIEEPTKFVWPLRSANIIVQNDQAALLDARFLSVRPGTLRYQVAGIHHRSTLVMAALLDKLS